MRKEEAHPSRPQILTSLSAPLVAKLAAVRLCESVAWGCHATPPIRSLWAAPNAHQLPASLRARRANAPLIVLISLHVGTLQSLAVPVHEEVRSMDESGEKRREERARVSPIWDPRLVNDLSSAKTALRTSMSRPKGSPVSSLCLARRFRALAKRAPHQLPSLPPRTTPTHRSIENSAISLLACLSSIVPSV